jgi:hypothetical protein
MVSLKPIAAMALTAVKEHRFTVVEIVTGHYALRKRGF